MTTEGTVKWFNHEKGFGFIECPGQNDLFVHFTSFDPDTKSLNEGDRVEFTIEKGPKGLQAANVKKID